MNHKSLYILLIASLASRFSLADRLASLPGGMLFPAFSSASLVNSASISLDWRREAKVLYSPPLNGDEPHAYLSGVGFSNKTIGLNLGYFGSYQNNSSVDSAFSGLSYRFGRLALGVSLRKPQIKNDSPAETDLSAILALNPTTRIGVVAYRLGEEPQISAGIGFGRAGKRTLAIDLLFPAKPRGKGMADQYAASVAFTDSHEFFAYSLGMKFSRQQDGFLNENQVSGSVGTTFSISKSLNLMSLYQSNPHTITVGFVWLWTPSARENIRTYESAKDS